MILNPSYMQKWAIGCVTYSIDFNVINITFLWDFIVELRVEFMKCVMFHLAIRLS